MIIAKTLVVLAAMLLVAYVLGRVWKKEVPKIKPTVVCLCGSTRFMAAYNVWRAKLTYEGKIVLSVELITTQTKSEDPQHSNHALKEMLDELHLRKIDLADEVFVLNVDGYVGESTAMEIAYAKDQGKPINYLVPIEKEIPLK